MILSWNVRMNTPKESTIGKNTSLEKAFSILDCFINDSAKKMTATELCKKTGLNFTTCYRLSEALYTNGYLFKDEAEKTYSLGWKFMIMSNADNATGEKILQDIAPPYMVALRDFYQENVSIYVQIERMRKCLIRIEGTQLVRNMVKQGSVAEIYLGSPGKTLLAFLPSEEREKYADIDDQFERELDRIRAAGYAMTTAEKTSGVTSISAPIFNGDGRIIGALTLSGPTFRFTGEDFEEKIIHVRQCAQQITSAIKHHFQSWHGKSLAVSDGQSSDAAAE